MEAMLLVHVAATWFMVGLIWFIQLVHYPLFHGVGTEQWGTYAAAHTRRTTWVVGPAMALEAIPGRCCSATGHLASLNQRSGRGGGCCW